MSRNIQTRFYLYFIALTRFAASKSNQSVKKCRHSDSFLLYCKISIYFSGDQYCIEINCIYTYSKNGGAQYISTFRNDQLVNTTLFVEDQIDRICFDSIDIENDIIEIRSEGIFNEDYIYQYNDFHFAVFNFLFINGEVTKLLLGSNEQPEVFLGNFLLCFDDYEQYVPAIKIKNETVIESDCKGLFKFSIFLNIFYLNY